jgi:hypothetical protein
MKNAGFWEKVVGHLAHPPPRHAIRLAALREASEFWPCPLHEGEQ